MKGAHPEGLTLDEHPEIHRAVMVAVDDWLRWVAKWTPSSQRIRPRVCRKCTGSPFVKAAGLESDVPHQVTHALIARMHRIIDRAVDDYTQAHLPTLQAELDGESMWKSGGFDPAENRDPEFDGLDVDPEPEAGQPFLFTMSGLAEETAPEPALPRPPLSAKEKQQLRADIERADQVAAQAGRLACFALAEHQGRITSAIDNFVEPRIQELLDELSQHLEPPR